MLSNLTSSLGGLLNKNKEQQVTSPVKEGEEPQQQQQSEDNTKESSTGTTTLQSLKSSLPSWLTKGSSQQPTSPPPEEQQKQSEDKQTSDSKQSTPTSGADDGDVAQQADLTTEGVVEGEEHLQTKVKQFGTALFSKLVEGAGKLRETNPITQFSREQNEFLKAKMGEKVGVAPWVGHVKEKELREEVMALSGDRRNFVRPPPPGISFEYSSEDEMMPIARALLKEDPNLEKMRYELVPKVVKEVDFWRNYLYRVSLLREDLGREMKRQDSASTDDEQDKGDDDGDFEVVKKEKELDLT